MELQTISEVSKQFTISTRTLRYYEQIGLIQPTKKEDFSYRTYDEASILRLKQIITLRKLRIPLKSIAVLLQTESTALAIEVLQQNLNEIGDEITALTTIQSVIQSFLERLNLQNVKLQWLDDESLLEIVDSLTVSKIKWKENKTMDDLSKASETLNKLTDKDVRIVYLPPSAVAASHYIGNEPEHHAAMVMDQFVRESTLPTIKPDMRQYGFNHPNPGCIEGSDEHGYEFWVTIPDNMEVPDPLIKKHFKGGLYAAHMIPMGAFEEWSWLLQWAYNNDMYDANLLDDSGQCMCGLLEEHLNYRNNVWKFVDGRYDHVQLDLLVPIKEKR